jgi:hypothetical protein
MTSLPDHGLLDQPPVLFDATPSSLKNDAESIIAATVTAWDAIVSQVQTQNATFENCIMPISQDENTRSQKQRVCKCASAADSSPIQSQPSFSYFLTQAQYNFTRLHTLRKRFVMRQLQSQDH